MKVVLQRDWFCDGSLYIKQPFGIDIPDQYRDLLPQGAKVIDEKIYRPAPVTVGDPTQDESVLTTLADFDSERHETDQESAFKKRGRPKKV